MQVWPFRKTRALMDVLPGRGIVDFHTHILPGVDDGVSTMDEALAVLAEYEKAGVKELWLTPHIMEDIPNTTDGLRGAFDVLKNQYKGKISLFLAAENMMDNLFEARLASGDLLPLGKTGQHLLVETSYFNPPMNMSDFFSKIKSAGYFPVLAHPERYVYMDERDYIALKQEGVLFQLNIASLVGLYGQHAKKKAEFLIEKGWYDISGTDVHRLAQIQKIMSMKTDVTAKKFSLEYEI